jgi:hypothetical protein
MYARRRTRRSGEGIAQIAPGREAGRFQTEGESVMPLQWRRDKTEHDGDIDDGQIHEWEANGFPEDGGYLIEKLGDENGNWMFVVEIAVPGEAGEAWQIDILAEDLETLEEAKAVAERHWNSHRQ